MDASRFEGTPGNPHANRRSLASIWLRLQETNEKHSFRSDEIILNLTREKKRRRKKNIITQQGKTKTTTTHNLEQMEARALFEDEALPPAGWP